MYSIKYLCSTQFSPQISEEELQKDKQHVEELAKKHGWSEFEMLYPSERSVVPGDIIQFRTKNNELVEHKVTTNAYFDDEMDSLKKQYDISDDEVEYQQEIPKKLLLATHTETKHYFSGTYTDIRYEWLPREIYEQTTNYKTSQRRVGPRNTLRQCHKKFH